MGLCLSMCTVSYPKLLILQYFPYKRASLDLNKLVINHFYNLQVANNKKSHWTSFEIKFPQFSPSLKLMSFSEILEANPHCTTLVVFVLILQNGVCLKFWC